MNDSHRTKIVSMDEVHVNVSGVSFEFSRDIFDNGSFEHHTLYKMCKDAEQSGSPSQLKVRRSSECFAAILSYYQTQKLHMPQNVCPGSFKDELEYWGIDHNILESCCLYRYITHLQDMETHQSFRASQKPSGLFTYTVPATSVLQGYRQRIWSVIDKRDNSVLTKAYTGFLLFMVVVSIVAMAYSTEPYCRRSLTVCEYMEYLKETGNPNYPAFFNRYGNIDCSEPQDGSAIEDDWSTGTVDWLFNYMFDLNDDNTVTTTDATMNFTTTENPGSKRSNATKLPILSAQHIAFDFIEYVCVAFFTIDFILRICFCPSLLGYFTSVVNLLDVCALLASYAHLISMRLHVESRYMLDSWASALEAIQILRIFRTFRFVKDLRASRVLNFSLKQNLTDMVLLALFLFLSISLFATLLYFTESRNVLRSIPEGWYWAVVTLTTVGYGDISPESGPGRFISCICAIIGVLLLAITLPLFVNNFLTLYQFSSIDDMIEQKNDALTKKSEKLKSSSWTNACRRSSQVFAIEQIEQIQVKERK